MGGGQGVGMAMGMGAAQEGRNAEDVGHVAGRLFVRYSSAILRSLDFVKQVCLSPCFIWRIVLMEV